jgi:hypothetical protein
MNWPLTVYQPEPNDIRKTTVVSTSPLVLIMGVADPGTSTSAPFWKVWKETYDTNGVVVSLLFMNNSRRRDQIYANAQAAGTTFS